MYSRPASHRQPRVGLIATLLSTAASYRGAGIHTYSRQLLEHLAAQGSQTAFCAFVGDPAYQPPPGLTIYRSARPGTSPMTRILWEQMALPILAQRQQIDLWHGLAYALPLASSCPGVVTVHDLSFLRHPQAFNRSNRLYLSRMVALSCRRARRVIAVSEATAAEVHELLGVSRSKIDVVYNGVDDEFRQLPLSAVGVFREQAGWPERFILSVGTLEPRKNYPVLIRAYARYRQISPQPLPLVIGGGKGWRYEDIFALVHELGLDHVIHFLGYVPAAQLPWLYNAATLFVYPSLYEGFGLPVAEAMACGTPAITSTASSLPEVAGEAALTVAPGAIDELADVMHDVLSSEERMHAMQQAGLAQAQRFQWQTTAAQTAAVYARVGEWGHG